MEGQVRNSNWLNCRIPATNICMSIACTVICFVLPRMPTQLQEDKVAGYSEKRVLSNPYLLHKLRDCSLFMAKGGGGGVGDFQPIQAYEKLTPPRKWVF